MSLITNTADTTETDQIAAFVSSLTLDDVPNEMKQSANRVVHSVLSARDQLRSSRSSDSSVGAMTAVLRETPARASNISSPRPYGPAYSALIDAAIAVTPLGDVESDAEIALVVAAAGIAVAEAMPALSKDLHISVIAGLEVAARVKASLGPSHAARGWRLAGTAGRVGASVASARVLHLSKAEICAAIGFAATQPAGYGRGSPPIACLVAGRAAHDGVEAAWLSAAGLIGPRQPLEGRRGLLALTSQDGDPRRLTQDIGLSWISGTLDLSFLPNE